ncbi:MAG: heavy metal-responsive transcriptional regulator [Cyanobacteria bacterium PR.023]|nr:heavy metal-responsive transcriptional regulator [Cyanobacteria bacterium PR.023]
MRASKGEEGTASGLTIGQIATKTGTSVETLRYYEKFGLLEAPERTSANYRLFSQETIRVVKFIKKAQELGFTLKDIKQLLYLYNSPTADDDDVKAISLALLRDIDNRINTLNTMRSSLSELVAQCAGKHPVKHCPILNALDV